ncbi:hypothetical protein L1D51_21100, partial [Pseudoalteromonas shioyasakiensis]|uniref:hypothetical protein n=1 Tax=Pseudoalteromonas shioyasakiensis TaxID=1190813 RepID=UPI001EFD29B6
MDNQWLQKVNADNKGIWGVLTQRFSTRGADCLYKVTQRDFHKEILDISIDHDTNELIIKFEEKCFNYSTYDDLIYDIKSVADEFKKNKIRLIFRDFHIANDEQRYNLLKKSRALHESCSGVSLQFIFCGEWSYFEYKNYFENSDKRTISPSAEYKNIVEVPQVECPEIEKLLFDQRLISSNPSYAEKVLIEYLRESTDGNEFLLGQVIEALTLEDGNIVENAERVISELSSSNKVIEYVTNVTNQLSDEERLEINKLLFAHKLIRPGDCRHSEKLWIFGLVKKEKVGSNKQLISISNKIFDKALRNINTIIDKKVCMPPENVCFNLNVIAREVFKKVAAIENLLRNIAVSVWYEEFGENWKKQLNRAKTPFKQNTETIELISLVLQCVRDEFPHLDNNDKSELSNSKEPHTIQRSSNTTVLESANDWMTRVRQDSNIELSEANIMHFLTSESLKSVYTNKNSHLHGDKKLFKNKNELQIILESF